MAAILWGPLVLAEDMGPRAVRREAGAKGVSADGPVLVTGSQAVSDWLKPIVGQPGRFRAEGRAWWCRALQLN